MYTLFAVSWVRLERMPRENGGGMLPIGACQRNEHQAQLSALCKVKAVAVLRFRIL